VETTPSVSSSTSLQYPNRQLVTYSPSVDSLLSPSLTPSSYNSPPPSHTFPVTYSLPSSAMSPLTESFFSDQIEFSFWFFSLGRTFLLFVSSHSAFILLSIRQNRYRPMCTFSFFHFMSFSSRHKVHDKDACSCDIQMWCPSIISWNVNTRAAPSCWHFNLATSYLNVALRKEVCIICKMSVAKGKTSQLPDGDPRRIFGGKCPTDAECDYFLNV